ncbi:uncharacterized protein Z518_11378 [Rhinocladiella mackenziei CBS 650.93]|uniref:Uncharacterized protein n=1 Tax=Rhinocladiella mackenziei CBS 650.93 TaxID=1442369 RepID=A0A0D2I823_9EURO|nr:uncharacterized protein Z518_11378 [Rhinocladiella mackenziei CBS 650.93]KIW99390.1 hypothetical protein Z518_11378 [Rhinocladiella mackenziei CBS 650.93]
MPSSQRPAKRMLVRWSDDLDKGVLLAVQYASAEAGIKLPWARVAELMGPRFTEGAIVQHLTKLRGIMAKNGIPVPPPLKRGMVTKEPSKIYASANNKHSFDQVPPMHPGTPEVKTREFTSIYDKSNASVPAENEDEAKDKAKVKAKAKGKGKGRCKTRRNMSDDDDDEEDDLVPELYDTDDWEYGHKKKRIRRVRAKNIKTGPDAMLFTPTGQIVKVEDTRSAVSTKVDDSAGPATRTRGVKHDYSITEAGASDEEAEIKEEMVDNVDNVDDVADRDDADDAGGELSSEEQETVACNETGRDDTVAAHDATRVPIIRDALYGQMQMDDHFCTGNEDLALRNQVLFGANPITVFSPMNFGSSSFMAPHGMVNGQFQGNAGNMFDGSQVGGQFGTGMVDVSQYLGEGSLFTGMPMVNPVQQGYSASRITPNMYPPSTTSSYPGTRNNSVATRMTASSLTSPSDNEAIQSGMVGAVAARQAQPEDVLCDHDMSAGVPSEEIVWGGGHYVDGI